MPAVSLSDEKVANVLTYILNSWNNNGGEITPNQVAGESRGDTQLDQQLFCGAGAASSVDPNDYAAFMRYALRSSYSAHYTVESLGFRCALGATEE